MDLTQEDYIKSKTNRLPESEVNRIISLTSEDDMMLEITDLLKETEIVPTPGRYYTFIYLAKTPRIEYDEFPLVACTNVQKWGFRGLNYHWGEFRNYTWEEIPGYLHVVYPEELKTLRSIPYQNFKINN